MDASYSVVNTTEENEKSMPKQDEVVEASVRDIEKIFGEIKPLKEFFGKKKVNVRGYYMNDDHENFVILYTDISNNECVNESKNWNIRAFTPSAAMRLKSYLKSKLKLKM
jgi:hypothetical protein